jgi:hypothetical protein
MTAQKITEGIILRWNGAEDRLGNDDDDDDRSLKLKAATPNISLGAANSFCVRYLMTKISKSCHKRVL